MKEELPDKIEVRYYRDKYCGYREKSDGELLEELIEKFNRLLEYLSQEEETNG